MAVKVVIEVTGGVSTGGMGRDRTTRSDTTIQVTRADLEQAIFAAMSALYMVGGEDLQQYVEDRLPLIGPITDAIRMSRGDNRADTNYGRPSKTAHWKDITRDPDLGHDLDDEDEDPGE